MLVSWVRATEQFDPTHKTMGHGADTVSKIDFFRFVTATAHVGEELKSVSQAIQPDATNTALVVASHAAMFARYQDLSCDKAQEYMGTVMFLETKDARFQTASGITPALAFYDLVGGLFDLAVEKRMLSLESVTNRTYPIRLALERLAL